MKEKDTKNFIKLKKNDMKLPKKKKDKKLSEKSQKNCY